MKYVKAKPISYGGKRSRKAVKAIPIHYTGNDGDTALGNASYFHRAGDGNTRSAGAHFFIDQKGNVVKSIPMNLTAWAVGDWEGTANGGGSLHGIYNNANTVSIELCDIASKNPSKEMIKATKKTIKYIRRHCPNAKVVCRHWDISGKSCPARMTGLGNPRWIKFLKDIGELQNARPKIKSVPKYPTKNIKKGDYGVQVESLQKCLNKIDNHPTSNVKSKTRAKIKELMK